MDGRPKRGVLYVASFGDRQAEGSESQFNSTLLAIIPGPPGSIIDTMSSAENHCVLTGTETK